MENHMFGNILQKELLSNILNFRFIVAIVLSGVLTVSCVAILTNEYKEETRDYEIRISLQDEFLSRNAHTNRMDGMIDPQKPPQKFHPVITGIPDDGDLGSFDDNPLPVLFPPIDLLFIITVIMSLMAIIFSYDAISGEREDATLKLMAANSLSRAYILLGKWMAGILCLLIPLAISLLFGLLYIAIQPGIEWQTAEWLALGLIFLGAIFYISLFYLLGISVSLFSRYSHSSILSALFLWVLIILVIPNLSPYVAAQLIRVPSVNEIERKAGILTGIERDDLGRKLSREFIAEFDKKFPRMNSEKIHNITKEELRKQVAADDAFKALFDERRKGIENAWNEANRIQDEKAQKLWVEVNAKSRRQVEFAKYLAAISPFSNFIYIATDLSGTGLRGPEYFDRLAREYLGIYYGYQDNKVREAVKKDPTFDSNSFLDINDRPRFVFREESLSERIKGILPYMGMLLFFNVALFAVSFLKIIRYDVR